MKLLDTEARLLTNDELRAVLKEEVAADQREGRTSTTLVQVHQYLEDHGSGAKRQQIESFVEAVKPLELLKSELLQLVNIKPSALVDVHLIVEGCEERLQPEQIEELLAAIQTHLQ